MAKEAGIRIGAHPGFPDLMGFGRRNLSVSPAEAKAYMKRTAGSWHPAESAENDAQSVLQGQAAGSKEIQIGRAHV